MVKFLLKSPFSRIIIPVIALAMLSFALVSVATNPAKPKHKPEIKPSVSPYKARVAGVGIIEPKSELISVGTNISGIVTGVYVKVGDIVKSGDKLFTIDEREAKAALTKAEARLASVKAEYERIKDQYYRYVNIKNKQAISKEELNRRNFALKDAEAKVKEAKAAVEEIETTIARLTVNAPIDGEILNLNVRLGEFAQAGVLNQPLIIMGDTSVYHVRVEVDQTDALKINENAMATGILRGYSDKSTELIFIRKEPLIMPKQNLTRDSRERVDTRVQEVIYAFDNKGLDAQIGQQMDVYIEDKEEN